MSSKAIFISHAVANKELADKLVDLLETGIGISDSNIFCSSVEGIGIPSGNNFSDFIRTQISNSKVAILLLTPEYFKSIFCLCELGASWILSHNIIPLLVPPSEYSDVTAVLAGVQVRKINKKPDLNEMQRELITALNIRGKEFVRWEGQRDKFLNELTVYLKPCTPSKSILKEDFESNESKKSSLSEYCKVLLSKNEIYEIAGNLIESNPPKKRILLGALHGFAQSRIPEEPSSHIFHQRFSEKMHKCTLDFNWEVKELYNITTEDRYLQIHKRLSSRMSAENYEARAFCNRTSLPILCPLIIGDQDAFLSLEDDKFYQVKSGYYLHGKKQFGIAEEYFFKLWYLDNTFKIWENGKMNTTEMERIKKQIDKKI
ncbi:MAG: toll/interleukin-1 receptor domain-containing protein [Candidatus Brocadia sp.]|nr:toll/interleukin-1 receptor domain-containing protein [Candidatus Brocadia sp.]